MCSLLFFQPIFKFCFSAIMPSHVCSAAGHTYNKFGRNQIRSASVAWRSHFMTFVSTVQTLISCWPSYILKEHTQTKNSLCLSVCPDIALEIVIYKKERVCLFEHYSFLWFCSLRNFNRQQILISLYFNLLIIEELVLLISKIFCLIF